MTIKRCCSGRKRVEAKKRTMDRSSADTRVHHSPILRPSTFPKSHFLPNSNDLLLPGPVLPSICECRPVCSLLQKEPGWKAGRRTKPLLLYCRLQRKLKEGIVARRKPLHYISSCRQNNECINAKKHALTHFLHYCAHSYLYLHLPVLPVDALTRRPPIEPENEGEADKVGQKSYFIVWGLSCAQTSSEERMLFALFFFFIFGLTGIQRLSHLFFWCFNGVFPQLVQTKVCLVFQ